MRYKIEEFNPLSGERLQENFGPRNPLRLQAQMQDRFAGEPWEYQVPQGTPNWAFYGSLPARALTHLAAQPVRDVADAAVHTGDVARGSARPDLGKLVPAAGLVAGGGMLPFGPKGALKTGVSESWSDLLGEIKALGQEIAKPDPKKFEPLEFVSHYGDPVDVYTNPKHAAAAAYHFAKGNMSLASKTLSHMMQYDPDHFGDALDHLLSANPKTFFQMHTLTPEDVKYINSVPEHSEINPWMELAKHKAGEINELPKHLEKPKTYSLDDYDDPEPPFVAHPFDKKVMSPSVIRRSLSNAIEPYNWEMSSNSAPELRAWNMYHRPEMLDDPRFIRAQDQGFNLAHPLVKGLDANKWKFVEPEWERATNNPLRVGAIDPYAEAFTDPSPGRGKPAEHALFAADTPIVSNEYTDHYTSGQKGVPGSQNFLLYARANNPAQVYWPEVNHGFNYYDRQTMHNLINEMLNKDHDLLAIQGINDLGGTHTQYAIAKPEQFRAIGAKFDPQYMQYPNLLLSQGNPFALNYLEPNDDRTIKTPR